MVSKGFPNVITSGRQYNIGEKPSAFVGHSKNKKIYVTAALVMYVAADIKSTRIYLKLHDRQQCTM